MSDEITDLNVEIEALRAYTKRLQDENRELKENLEAAEERADQENRRCSSITKTYCGMRTRLDMAFGTPNGKDRTEKGRAGGLEGAVDFAIAEYGRVTRLLREAK